MKGSPWVMRWDQGYPQGLLNVLFDPATPIGLYRQPLKTARGVMVVELLERKQLTRAELEASKRS